MMVLHTAKFHKTLDIWQVCYLSAAKSGQENRQNKCFWFVFSVCFIGMMLRWVDLIHMRWSCKSEPYFRVKLQLWLGWADLAWLSERTEMNFGVNKETKKPVTPIELVLKDLYAKLSLRPLKPQRTHGAQPICKYGSNRNLGGQQGIQVTDYLFVCGDGAVAIKKDCWRR